MTYDLDENYLAAIQFAKRFSEGYDKEQGYAKTFANSVTDKASIAQRNSIITLLIQIIQKLEKIEGQILQLQQKESKLDVSNLTQQLSKNLKISLDTTKKKKELSNTFFMYTPENLKS